VEGDEGIGKSRLVREILGSPALAQRRVLVGHCQRLREPFLLGPVVEALQGLQAQLPRLLLGPVGGALRSLLPELAPMLPENHVPMGDSTAALHQVFRALRELFGALGPTICVLEDLQWADDVTLEFLEFLSLRLPEELVIVVTYRSDEVPPASSLARLASRPPREAPQTTIELRSLSDEEVRGLVGAILGSTQVSHEFARCLRALTAGVPSAVEEVIRLLDGRDRFALAAGGRAMAELERAGVPPAISQSVRERMGSLSHDACLVARAAGVLGVPEGEKLVAGVADLPPARAIRALTRALQSGPLEEKGYDLYGFRHPLAAQAACRDAPGPQRRRMHLRAAQALAGDPQRAQPARLAHHFKEAGCWGEWVRHAEAAAAAARCAGDDRSAAHLLEQALCAPGVTRAARIRMAVELGHAASSAVSETTTIVLLQRTLDEEGIPLGTRGELRFCLARLRRKAGDTGSWREEMARAVEELRERPELAARAMTDLAQPALSGGSLQEDLRWLRRGVDAAALTADPATKVEVRAKQAAILLGVGDPAGWRAVEETPPDGGTLDEHVHRLRGYCNVSVAAMHLGHHGRSESLLATAARIAELHAMPWDPWRASAGLALDWRMGRWDGLEARAHDLIRAASGISLFRGSELVLGSLLATRGQVEEAEHVLAAAARPPGESRTYVTAVATLAGLRLDRGDASEARRLVAPPLDAIERKGIWVWAAEMAPIAVRALLARGERTEAQRLTAAFGAGLRGRDAPAARAAESLCEGAVAEAQGRPALAAKLFARAQRAWVELPAPYEAASAREAEGRCLLARDDERGAQLLRRAFETFEGLGASADASRVRAQLKAQGITLASHRRGGRRAYGNQLSPREAEVARLAGAGRRNREIAETLFISTRTVEAHVASALRKLGVDSRHALAGPEAARALDGR
jgi:DNA-binding CsgD family transcriptional regulator